ncbi:hypothetical protein SAMN02745225_01855 [Ferrithrix thermotolerans DSM 19514]|jgi:hypothetical protein|uniref:Prenyltransferase and squalene oxidase repeat-containing protein n=1 Tax=Ferrithrix thermotolerans DSM 19514 TaxID=1121881 RepID=A0A1M4X1I3_9ACTN|nr:hypothetical protein [Ferrithrix thermotolerans]SHE87237.1 hypothetical protein SAMN02745225_01855 [Ferrithrix thermotolerans DSM 19514]
MQGDEATPGICETKSQMRFLNGTERDLTLDFVSKEQLDNGFIPWTADSFGDPWNHSEAVIALILGGRYEEAYKGLVWLLSSQNHDGSLCQFYMASGVKEPRRDLNCCAYPFLALLLGVRAGVLDPLEPRLKAFIKASARYILSYQYGDGGFPWAVDPDGKMYHGRLLSASSSMVTSLRAGVLLGEMLDEDLYELESAAKSLASLIKESSPEGFLDKQAWAMDWYYPILAVGSELKDLDFKVEHLFERHLERGLGICCLSTSRWVTTAETAEFAMALSLIGRSEEAVEILTGTFALRRPDGSYFTGVTIPGLTSFPHEECSTYSAAAVVIADAVISAEGNDLLSALMNAVSDASLR